MATRSEARFGEITGLGTAYTLLCTVAPGHTYNFLFNVCNRTGAVTANLRLYIADASWTTGEPTGGTIKAAVAYDLPITAGDTRQITGIIGKGTEKIVAQASVASSLDITANGVDVV